MIIKRKLYSTAVLVGDKIKNAAHASLPTAATSAFNDMPADTSIKNMKKVGAANRAGRFEPTRNLGGVESYAKSPKVATGKQAFQMGQSSVGIKQGAMNTWNRMGKAGKAGTVAAGVGGLYLMGKGLLGRKKKE